MTRKERTDQSPDAQASYHERDQPRVTENPTPATKLQKLSVDLRAQQNITDLFRLAASDEFKAEASSLTQPELKSLRDLYNELRTALDGKVRLDTFDGVVVNVIGVEWWHSDSYDADGVTLHLRTETEDKRYKVLTSSAPIVQFANSFKADALPSEKHPARVIFALVPVSDSKRAAQGHKKWSVKRLSIPQTRTTDGTPF